MKKLYLLTTAAILGFSTFTHADIITMWTFEEKPERMAIQQKIVDRFKQASGHDVELIPVSETKIGERITAAFSADDLPDVIYYPAMFTKAWAEAGMLDIDSGTFLVEKLGIDHFSEAALKQVFWDGNYTGVPTDSMIQMIYYRKDLFDKNDLSAPDNYENILAAAEKLHNPPEIYGFVIPTKVDDVYMSQVIEHIMMANAIDPIDQDGNVNMDEKALREALTFYKKLKEYSPPGDLYWKQSRELYFAGKAAQIFWSGALLDELGGLRDSAPITINDDPTSKELAQKTGFITAISGTVTNQKTGFSGARILSVSTSANTPVAEEFILYLINNEYANFLSISPENKFPALIGDDTDNNKFVKQWLKLPIGVDRFAAPAELYGQDFIDTFTAGVNNSNRWGRDSNQGERISRILVSFTLSRIIREYLDGKNDLDTTINIIYDELEKIQ